ncbi:hypothetical protein [Paraburkholderia tuberum]|uniref:hypothetical protein n=1 Tax=Paraburkholderia TaxID=1822464 RepID=UPI000477BD0C|nr:hypothetical protein [Paraburkholderia tuberum]
MVDHLPMVIHLSETQIRTLEQVRAVHDGTQALEFSAAADAHARCEWIASVLNRFRYGQLRRVDRGLLLRYLRRFGGFSRAHVTRLVLRWLDGSNLTIPKRKAPPNAFARRYTEAELDTLAEIEHGVRPALGAGHCSCTATHVSDLRR